MAKYRTFRTKVAGVSFKGRQRIVAKCSQGELLKLVRDPTDRYDKGAIKVERLNGEQLGFIPAHVSRSGNPSGLSFRMDQGQKYQCRIATLTGGGPGRKLGVNIEITNVDDFDEALTKMRSPSESRNVVPATVGWLLTAAVIFVFILILVRNLQLGMISFP
jgi:hypothetical protein